MLYVNNTSNYGVPVGMVENYNNTSPAEAVQSYRTQFYGSYSPVNYANKNENDFSKAIYGNGPYSLSFPKCSSDVLAKNIDYVA